VTPSSLHADVTGSTLIVPAASTLFTHSSSVAFSTSPAITDPGRVERSNRISALDVGPIFSAGSLPKFFPLSAPLALLI